MKTKIKLRMYKDAWSISSNSTFTHIEFGIIPLSARLFKVLLGENDETQGYLDIFKGNGAFVNKSTDLLAPKPVVATVAKSTDSKKDLTADTSKVSTITGKKMEFKGAKENGK